MNLDQVLEDWALAQILLSINYVILGKANEKVYVKWYERKKVVIVCHTLLYPRNSQQNDTWLSYL